MRTRQILLLSAALSFAACQDRTATPLAPEVAPPEGPQLTFGTPQHDEATATAVRGSGIYVVGVTAGSLDGPNLGSFDAFIRKYHPEGEVLWRDQFGTRLQDRATGVAADNAGNAYVVGWTEGSLAGSRGGLDAFIRKYDTKGKLLWTRQFGTTGTDRANAVSVDGSGNVYVAGETFGAMQGSHQGLGDAFVRKYSPSGGVLWTRQFGTTTTDAATGVATDANGDVFVVGSTLGTIQGTSAGAFDAFIRKYNSDGSVAWTRQFGTSGLEVAWAVAADGTGAAIVAGETSGTLRGSNAGGSDAFVRKYSSSGEVVATRQFGTASGDIALAISTDQDDNFYVTGLTGGALSGSNAGNLDVFVRKYNSSSSHQWTTQFGTPAEDRASAVAAASSSAIYLAGRTAGTLVGANSGGFDAFLRRLDASGQPVWTDQ